MPFVGTAPNKTYQRTDGTRTGSQTWQQADAAGVDIIAPDHDTHDQDIGDSLSLCLLRDGGNTATSNIPMGGFKFTSLGDAAAPTQALTLSQHAANKGQYCTVGGTGNAITLTTGYTLTAYAAGQSFTFIVGTTNTDATTVNVDSLGVKSLVRSDGANTALSSNDLVAGSMVEIQYDGTRFHLRSSSLTSASGDVLARIVKAGSIMAWPHSTVPAGWLECYGQAISRSTYAELYAAIGTTYGVGDGSTTFNLPDLRGRVIAGEDDMGGVSADRLTGLTNGVDGDILGTTGGLESVTISNANLPNVNLAHTISISGSQSGGLVRSFSESKVTLPAGSGAGGAAESLVDDVAWTTTTLSITGTVPLGGSGTAHNNVQPTIIMKWIILALPATAAAGVIGVHGLQYSWSTATSGDPGSGTLLVNNATLASATAINISETDANGAGVAAWLATWDDSTNTIRGYIHITKVGAPGQFMIYAVSGSLTDNGTYDTLTITHVASNGSFASGQNVSVLFYRTGDKGDTGATGATGASGVDAGVRYNFDSSTTMADPGTGDIRLNNATLASVTAIAVSDLTAETGNPDASVFVLAWDDSTNTALRGTVVIKKISAPANFAIYSITGASTDNTGWTQLAVTHVASSGSFSDTDSLSISWSRTGDIGATGTSGTDAGARWLFDSSTTTTVDPGTGDFRLNNATLSSVTEIAISYSCAESGNPSLENWVKAWDDSTTTSNRGTIILKKVSAPQNIAIYSITSTITDGTTYGRYTLSHMASSGSFSNTDTMSVQFVRTGDKGTDGAGAGDVTAASAFGTDNLVIRSDGTVKGVQASAVTIDDSGNVSGVVALSATSIELGHASDTTITRTSAGAIDVEGVGVALNSTSLTHTASTIELGHASDTTISRTGAGAIAVEGVGVALNSTSLAHTCSTLELGNASDTTLSRSAAGVLAVEGTIVKMVGKETIWIPAAAISPRSTNGAVRGGVEMSTNKNMFVTLDYSYTTQEFAQFEIYMPKSWNLSTVTFQPVWSHSSTTVDFGVVWSLAGVARSDDDAGDVAFGTVQTSTDTGGTTNDIYIGPESAAITIAGTPTAGDTVQFQIARVPLDGSDTMQVNARLHGLRLFFTTNAATDA